MRAGGRAAVVDTGHTVGSRAELLRKRRLSFVRGTYLSLSLIVQTGSGPANPSSYPMYKGLKGISFSVKQPQHEANQ
jgi:hypothetical protein